MGRAVDNICVNICFYYSRANYSGVGVLGHISSFTFKIHGEYIFHFVRNRHMLSRVAVSFCVPTTMYERCFCSTFTAALDIIEMLKF